MLNQKMDIQSDNQNMDNTSATESAAAASSEPAKRGRPGRKRKATQFEIPSSSPPSSSAARSKPRRGRPPKSESISRQQSEVSSVVHSFLSLPKHFLIVLTIFAFWKSKFSSSLCGSVQVKSKT